MDKLEIAITILSAVYWTDIGSGVTMEQIIDYCKERGIDDEEAVNMVFEKLSNSPLLKGLGEMSKDLKWQIGFARKAR
jgi:hypothetical protein